MADRTDSECSTIDTTILKLGHHSIRVSSESSPVPVLSIRSLCTLRSEICISGGHPPDHHMSELWCLPVGMSNAPSIHQLAKYLKSTTAIPGAGDMGMQRNIINNHSASPHPNCFRWPLRTKSMPSNFSNFRRN
jgi:hypothetical protein